MSDKPWNEKTEEEAYAHEPGSFNDQVDTFEISGEPELTMIARRVCREKVVAPRWLMGGVNRHGGVIFARRLLFRAAYERAELSVENIAAIFGYSVGYVRPWATSWKLFEQDDPTWWHYWGRANADLIGVPLEASA